MLGFCQKYTKIFYASIWMPLSLLTFPFRQIDKLDCLEIVALEIILSDISHKYLFMSVYVNSLNVRRIFSEKSVNEPGGGAEIQDGGSRIKIKEVTLASMLHMHDITHDFNSVSATFSMQVQKDGNSLC